MYRIIHCSGNSSKGEQNSNSLAGASFSTFSALMSAIAGIVFSSGESRPATVCSPVFFINSEIFVVSLLILDPKIRQRSLKKGVTLGDLTVCNAASPEGNLFPFVQHGLKVFYLSNKLFPGTQNANGRRASWTGIGASCWRRKTP